MVVDIWIENNWGYREITFNKKFDMDFVPFMGLRLTDNDGMLDVSLENNDIKTTIIWYNVDKKQFEVSIRKNWGKYGVSPEQIKNEIKIFKKLGWSVESSEDQINEMIEWVLGNKILDTCG